MKILKVAMDFKSVLKRAKRNDKMEGSSDYTRAFSSNDNFDLYLYSEENDESQENCMKDGICLDFLEFETPHGVILTKGEPIADYFLRNGIDIDMWIR